MLPRGTWIAATLALVLGSSSAAQAADPSAATITACKSDSIVVAGKVSLSGSSARKARGATLQLRFQALALFGLPHVGSWHAVGKKTKATGQEAFAGLAADNWVGVMSWRYKKGSRTVLSGLARSQPLRIGRSKGRANCTIAEGLKPVDKTPPALFMNPGDDAWHHAPVNVQVIANDDFSGVKSVRYSLDGGPQTQLPNGTSFSIPDQGKHTVALEATDVAGNTATRTATVRVDGAPPTKPAFSRPLSVTASTTPTFTWSASTDSGSDMKGYLLTVKRADGSVAAFGTVPPDKTSVPSPAPLNDGETYTAVVTAVDNTVDPAWTTDSDTLTFRVDSSPDITGSIPANGTILSGGLKGGPFTLNLDRAADPSTVSKSTVVIDRSDGSDPTDYTAKCTTSACTAIEVDLGSNLGEGRYAVRPSGVRSAGEEVPFNGAVSYAVPFVESGSIGPSTCIVPATSLGYAVSAPDTSETAFLQFDISGPGSWKMEALYNGSPISSTTGAGPGSGFRLEIPIGGHTGANLSFRLTPACGNTISAQNLFGSRNP